MVLSNGLCLSSSLSFESVSNPNPNLNPNMLANLTFHSTSFRCTSMDNAVI